MICGALGCSEAEGASQAGDGAAAATGSDASVAADGASRALPPYKYQYEPCTTYSPVVDAAVPVTLLEPLASICRAGPSAEDLAAPTKGPIPPEVSARARSGGENWELIPDFVAVAGREGIAGYVSKYELNCCSRDSVPVVDEGLQRIIGHMVANRGFVPLGADGP